MPEWSTACPDWERRLLAGESLIPFSPLFEKEALRAAEIFRDLPIVDAAGSPTMGQACKPWVFEFCDAVFGSYNHETGRRLIREFFLLVAKKNAKSTTAAGMMLTALLRNWRKSAEFLIIAPTLEIAQNSFKPAHDMIMEDPNLGAILRSQPHFRVITHRTTGATLKVIAADNEAVSGKKAVGVLVDELWLFGKRQNAENMLREAIGGLASRPEGFVIYLSTQSDEPPTGIFKQKLDYFRDVRDGKIHDPRSLPILYEFPKRMLDEERYKDPSLFHLTNPNLGASVDREFLEGEYKKADLAGPSSMMGFLAKHLNVELGIRIRANRWPGAEYWQQRADRSLTYEEVLERSEVIVVGIDGGGLDDLFGLAIIAATIFAAASIVPATSISIAR
jgi:phage terminase large subunit-like protein